MYDPAIARWISPDPYGQFASSYLAMGNAPGTVDPDGGLTFSGRGAMLGALIGGVGAFAYGEITGDFDRDRSIALILGGAMIGGLVVGPEKVLKDKPDIKEIRTNVPDISKIEYERKFPDLKKGLTFVNEALTIDENDHIVPVSERRITFEGGPAPVVRPRFKLPLDAAKSGNVMQSLANGLRVIRLKERGKLDPSFQSGKLEMRDLFDFDAIEKGDLWTRDGSKRIGAVYYINYDNQGIHLWISKVTYPLNSVKIDYENRIITVHGWDSFSQRERTIVKFSFKKRYETVFQSIAKYVDRE